MSGHSMGIPIYMIWDRIDTYACIVYTILEFVDVSVHALYDIEWYADVYT